MNSGTSHGDDTAYVLERNDMHPEDSDNDKAVSKQMITMFADFIKTG